MERTIGTTVRSLRTPIIREGDDIIKISIDTVLNASKEAGFEIQDKDCLCITESVVARAQGNYATIDEIAQDIKNKYADEHFGIIFPILSRNRFGIILKGIAKGDKKNHSNVELSIR
jgi:F420-0:Gamma-glutamyl ligase.